MKFCRKLYYIFLVLFLIIFACTDDNTDDITISKSEPQLPLNIPNLCSIDYAIEVLDKINRENNYVGEIRYIDENFQIEYIDGTLINIFYLILTQVATILYAEN